MDDGKKKRLVEHLARIFVFSFIISYLFYLTGEAIFYSIVEIQSGVLNSKQSASLLSMCLDSFLMMFGILFWAYLAMRMNQAHKGLSEGKSFQDPHYVHLGILYDEFSMRKKFNMFFLPFFVLRVIIYNLVLALDILASTPSIQLGVFIGINLIMIISTAIFRPYRSKLKNIEITCIFTFTLISSSDSWQDSALQAMNYALYILCIIFSFTDFIFCLYRLIKGIKTQQVVLSEDAATAMGGFMIQLFEGGDDTSKHPTAPPSLLMDGKNDEKQHLNGEKTIEISPEKGRTYHELEESGKKNAQLETRPPSIENTFDAKQVRLKQKMRTENNLEMMDVESKEGTKSLAGFDLRRNMKKIKGGKTWVDSINAIKKGKVQEIDEEGVWDTRTDVKMPTLRWDKIKYDDIKKANI